MNLTIKDFFKNLRLNEQKISQALGGLVVVVVGILIYNYFSAVNKQAEIAQTESEAKKEQTHTVAQGEYLWDISIKYYNDGYQWTKIAEANNLVNPDLLTEGQVLVLPVLETAVPAIAGAVMEQPATETMPNQYTVVSGDDLWNISVKMYADGYAWTKIWEANKDKIANANIIEIGQVLSIPR